jgi:hypothetical protein
VRAGAARGLEHQGLVEADAGPAVGECADLRCRRRTGLRRIEDDEVVAETVHFRERKTHSRG